MLDPQCLSMGEVVRCGLNGEKCYATDLFPLHVNINYLTATDRPFDDFPEFEELFLNRHLSNFLNIGGKVLLVFRWSAFGKLKPLLNLEGITLSEPEDDLRIFLQRVLEAKGLRS